MYVQYTYVYPYIPLAIPQNLRELALCHAAVALPRYRPRTSHHRLHPPDHCVLRVSLYMYVCIMRIRMYVYVCISVCIYEAYVYTHVDPYVHMLRPN